MAKIEDEIKSSFRSVYEKLLVNLQLTNIRLGDELEQQFKEHDITSTQYNVLRILRGQHQNPVSIGLIKERMIDRNSDASRIVDRLAKKNLITRTENKIDRRQKDIIISDEGLALLSRMDKIMLNIDDRLNHLTEEEAEQMNDLLDKMRSKDE
ncbi:MAG: MarR family transcriptional regulator [Crocinitomicaceae bacterium]|nr:MarR family transcriptional regulator [Crocinitomicaceae bacterium]